jgi:hypothetical protein
MAWNLTGSYQETCSCELMFPCNLSLDHGATDDQLNQLVRVGVECATVEVSDDGLQHSVRLGDSIDFVIEDVVPFGVDTGRPVRFDGMFHPVASNLTMAEAKHTRITAFGLSYEGKTGLSTAEFSWAA